MIVIERNESRNLPDLLEEALGDNAYYLFLIKLSFVLKTFPESIVKMD